MRDVRLTTEFIVTLSLVFSLWYGLAETYTWFAQGIYEFDTFPVFGIIAKIGCLIGFSYIMLTLFNSIKINMLTLGISGAISVFLKDITYRLLVTITSPPGEIIIWIESWGRILLDNLVFGIPFMLASYIIVNGLVKK